MNVPDSGEAAFALAGHLFFIKRVKAGGRNLPMAVDKMKLSGKTREQLGTALANKSRSELVDLIYSLVTVEQLLKPAEIAARSCLNKRAVLRDIRDGKFGDYYCRAENSIAVPASGVNKWRNNFRVPAMPKQEAQR